MSDQILPWPLVKRGSRGHPVPALRYLLRAQGHPVTVDAASSRPSGSPRTGSSAR